MHFAIKRSGRYGQATYHHHLYSTLGGGGDSASSWSGGGGDGGSWSGGGGHKSKNSALSMSALTLLAFLFFINMLQTCLKEQMTSLNPTVRNPIQLFIRNENISINLICSIAGNGNDSWNESIP